MGLRGPKPTPSKLLQIRGSWRGDINKSEPQPKPGRPVMPRTLTPQQAVIWRQLMAILDDMGVLTKADPFQLERYCVLFVLWRECHAHIAKNGISRTLESGYEMQRIEVTVAFRCDAALKQIESCFGLTPSARSRITLDGQQPKVVDPLEDFLNEAGG